MINEIVKDLKFEINKSNIAGIRFLALLGSYRENEAVSGYSDCDLLFILEADKYGNIPHQTLELLKETSEKLSSKYPVVFSFLTHTEFDLREYVDIEYLEHYSWGKVLLGMEDRFKELFRDILSKKDTTDAARKSLMYHNVIHARFNVLRKYVSLNKHNSKDADRQIAVLFIDKLVEIIDWILIYDGNYFETKQEIIGQFLAHNKDIGGETLSEILPLRSRLGGSVDASELRNFNRRASILLGQLSELIIKKHNL